MARKFTREDNVELQTNIKTLVNKICSSEDFISQLADSISKVIDNHFEDRIQQLEKDNSALKTKLKNYEEMIDNLFVKNEKLEQMSKNKAIRIYGVKEIKNESVDKVVLDIINQKMKVIADGKDINFRMEDIENCFRIGKPLRGKPRPILVNFIHQSTKNMIYNDKKKLKGSGIVIREDLTKEKFNIVKMALEKVGDGGNVWTNHGHIYVKLCSNGNIIQINSKEDLYKIGVKGD